MIAGTNRNLQSAVSQGRFREDLLARINLWTFQLPALRDRREDIEPNLEFELDQFARLNGTKVTFNKEARERFLTFATAADAAWAGNFRDLNAAVTRMATFAAGGRITADIVDGETSRLKSSWSLAANEPSSDDLAFLLGESAHSTLDPFDRIQLAEVLRVCRASRNLSEAVRQLFAISRTKKGTTNDADRLRKYLARFGLDWSRLQGQGLGGRGDPSL